MYGDGGFYFLQPVSPSNAAYGDGGFYFTQPVSPTNAAYGIAMRSSDPIAAFHAARIPRFCRSSYGVLLNPMIRTGMTATKKDPNCKKKGVWYIPGLDPCAKRPDAISKKEWGAYQKTGKVPSLYASSAPAGPTNCTDALKQYSTFIIKSKNPLLEGQVPPQAQLDALWCKIVEEKCAPDPMGKCKPAEVEETTETQEFEKSEASNTVEEEQGFFAKYGLPLAIGSVTLVIAGFAARKYGII